MKAGAPGKHVVIVGAGLAGSLLAVYLARQGWRVSVFERRGDPRAKGYAGGRSINLALSARGIDGLAGVGLDADVMRRDAIAMRGRMMHAVDGALTYMPYSADGREAINSVSRGGLNLTLIEAAAREANVTLHFDAPCVDVDLEAPAVIIGASSGNGGGASAVRRVECDLVASADGAYSAVRGAMMRTDRFDYEQSYLRHGYKELHIAPRAELAGRGVQVRPVGGASAAGGAPNGETSASAARQPGVNQDLFAMEANALHIWPRGGEMMIALPNRDGSFTCTLFWPFEGERGFGALRTEPEIEAFFARVYPDAAALMPDLAVTYASNPVGSLVTMKCAPWQKHGKVVLLGDAAHAIVPFYGQGMNAAFEDVRALARCLGETRDQRTALEKFEALRRPNADAIAEMAVENFVEMRDKVGQPEWLYRKKIEQTLHAAFPERVHPQYNLVSFATTPYVEARREGARLAALVAGVADRVRMPVGFPGTLTAIDEAWKARVRKEFLGLREDAIARVAPSAMGAERELIDITPKVTVGFPVWPGDTPLAREMICRREDGASVTLSALRATGHLGAHADGSNHYATEAEGGTGVGERPLAHYIGACVVVEARAARGARIGVSDLSGGIEAVTRPRVLLKTGTFGPAGVWNDDFAALSVELVEALAARGVVTIGIDTPSVDLMESKTLEAHRAIFRHDISIIEGLDLSAVDPDEYELLAAPLRLAEFDGSPVRAVLRRM
ncbi:hypothetical protein BH11PLA1_BH11PLA1_05010 [soil metagenome]